MASKSSAENVAASDMEGNTEDVMQLENTSAVAPSGVKAKGNPKTVTFKSCEADNLKKRSEIPEDHVNEELENRSGSSDSSNPVLNQPEKNGSSDSSSQKNLTYLADIIKAAHEAANIARDAAASCRKTLDDSYDIIEFCRKRFESCNRKAREAAQSIHASRSSSLAENYQIASERVGLLISEAERSADLADISAYSADSSATSLAEVVDSAPKAVGERLESATRATSVAKSAALTAYQRKHVLLKGMQESWNEVNSAEFLRTKSTVSLSDDGKCIKIGDIVCIFILSLVGLGFLVVPQFTKLNERTYEAVIASGFLVLVTSLGIFMYRLLRYISKQRKAGERKFRREMAARIVAELLIVEDYFEKTGMTETLLLAQSQG